MLYTNQLLENVKNVKNSISLYLLVYLLTLLNFSPNKYPFNQYHPKSVANPDILNISLPKNEKIMVLAKLSFLTNFPIFKVEISYVKMHLWGRGKSGYHLQRTEKKNFLCPSPHLYDKIDAFIVGNRL